MRTVGTLVALLLFTAGISGAQGYPKAYQSDSNIVAQNILIRLFEGIHLSTKQETEALSIIKRTFNELFVATPGKRISERVQRGSDLNAARDSVLKTLLKSEADRATFVRNAEALRDGLGPPPAQRRPPLSVGLRATSRSRTTEADPFHYLGSPDTPELTDTTDREG